MSIWIFRAAIVLLGIVACGCSEAPTPPTAPSPANVLPPFGPPLAGEYTLTLTAAASCVLPPWARQRTYSATLAEPQRGVVSVVLTGADFRWGMGGYYDRFQGTRDGNAVRFRVFLGERADDTTELSYDGVATTTLADSSISGTFSGMIWLNVAGDLYDGIADCAAVNHAIEFARHWRP